MSDGVRLPPWIRGSRQWVQELQNELTELPATLRLFRESVSNMQRITRRLLDATEAIEQLTALSTQTVEARERLDEAARSLRGRIAGSERSDPVTAAMGDVGEALSAMADLNPFLRRPGTRKSPPKSSKRDSGGFK